MLVDEMEYIGQSFVRSGDSLVAGHGLIQIDCRIPPFAEITVNKEEEVECAHRRGKMFFHFPSPKR